MSVLRLQIPAKMRPFVLPRRHKVARGGRGSGKSWSIARLLAARGVARRTRWLCCREIQKSIRESSHRLLADQIEALGLAPLYDVQRDVIRGPHGTEFVFAGLRDHTVNSIKSYEGFDGAWVEEAHTVSNASAQILIPTIRAPGSEIWWSYNPDQETDFVHTLAETGGDDVTVVTINWRDNPWFPAELDAERRKLKAINEDLYAHVWEGQCRTAAGLLFKRVWFKWYDEVPAHLNTYLASDYAVSEDEGDCTEHGIGGLDPSGDLYLVDWWHGQTAPETWIDAALALVRQHRPLIWFEEAGVIHRALDGAINKRMRELQTFVQRETLPSASSKAARALGFAARASAGTVYLPKGKPWAERLLNQLCAFNGEDGRADDGVDVCSLLARGLDQMADARKPAEVKSTVPTPFTEAWWERGSAAPDVDRARYYR